MGARPQNSHEPCLHWPSGPVAQLVEQGTFNPKVAGSIPARPITNSLHTRNFCTCGGFRQLTRVNNRKATAAGTGKKTARKHEEAATLLPRFRAQGDGMPGYRGL